MKNKQWKHWKLVLDTNSAGIGNFGLGVRGGENIQIKWIGLGGGYFFLFFGGTIVPF